MPQNDLVILHFNDVYNLEPQKEEPVGGAARFVSCVKSYQSLNPLVLFSGDVLNPSLCKHFKIWGKQYIQSKESDFFFEREWNVNVLYMFNSGSMIFL